MKRGAKSLFSLGAWDFAGDIILSLPSVKAIHEQHPGWRVIYHCWGKFADLVRYVPYLEYSAQFWTAGFDYKFEVSHETDELRPLQRTRYWGQIHSILAESLGLIEYAKVIDWQPEIWLPPKFWNVLLRDHAGERVAVVNLYSRNGRFARVWDVAGSVVGPKWREVVRYLAAQGWTIFQIGERNEPRLPEPVIDLCGQTSFLESVSLISLSNLVISIDTFAVHAACARKHLIGTDTVRQATPLIFLAGPTSRVGVVPPGVDSVIEVSSRQHEGDCPCWHSARTALCRYKADCMTGIEADQVIEAIEKLCA